MGTTRRRGVRTALILAAAIAAGATQADEVLYLAEGRVYRGEVLDGRPHGDGRMIWPSGALYVGAWSHGARDGAETYREPEGVTYVGEYRDGERSGHGRFTWPDGRSYDGRWHASMRHGDGIETLPGELSRRCTWRWGNVVRHTCAPDL